MKKNSLILILQFVLYTGYVQAANNEINEKSYALEELFEMSLSELASIEVTSASKRAQKLYEAPGTTYIVTEQDILKYGYRDLKDALKSIPGMEMVWSGFFLQGGQRGFSRSFSETLLLINGREVQSVLTGEMFISKQFPLHNVQRIEVVQGPTSALYGANAYLGVINIITKVEDKEYTGGELGLRYASWNTKEYDFTYATKALDNRFRVALSGRAYFSDEEDFTDFYDDPTFAPGYIDTPAHFPSAPNSENPYANESHVGNINAKISFDLTETAMIYGGIDQYKNDGGVGLQWGPQTTAKRIIEGTWDKRVQRMMHVGFNNTLLDNKVDFKVELQSWREDIYEGQQGYDWVTEILDRWEWNTSNLERTKIFAEIGYEYKLGDSTNHLITGLSQDRYDWKKSQNATNFVFTVNTSSLRAEERGLLGNDKNSLYLQNQTNIDDSWQITIGGRIDQQSTHGNTFNPRIALNFMPDQKTTWKFLFGKAFREPSGFELTYQLENLPILAPSKMKTYELSWLRSFDRFNLQAVAYLNQSENLIVEDEELARSQFPDITDFGIGERFFVNAENRDSRGFELSINFTLSKKLNGFTNWTYVMPDKDVAFSGTPEETNVRNLNIAENKVNLGLSYNLAQHFSISILDHWISSVKVDRPGEHSGNNQISKLDAYHDVSLTLSSERVPLSKSTEANFILSINNLFDSEFFHPDIRDEGAAVFLQDGRSISLKVELVF